MVNTIANVCDPLLYTLDEAIQKARSGTEEMPGFEINLVRFLQAQCLFPHVSLPIVFRGLEVLAGILDESRLVTLLRPFLRSSDRKIASKCVLVLGRQSRSMNWFNSIMGKADERIRANLVEALWKRKEPEIELVLRGALDDTHPRVAANAVYGLYLLGIDDWVRGFEKLANSDDAAFRRSAIWVIKSSCVPNAPSRLKRLIHDPDAGVRRAAFRALVHFREHGMEKASGRGVPAVPDCSTRLM